MAIGDQLNGAFLLGEKTDTASRRRAMDLYLTILKSQPSLPVAWFNAGVTALQCGLTNEAVRYFSKAEEEAEYRTIAAFARLTTLMKQGTQPKDSDFPREFRGEKKEILGVLGPCHNAANLIRRRYPCQVEQRSGTTCRINVEAEDASYLIQVSDMMGTLVKNVWRKTGSNQVNLINEERLSETDQFFLDLPVGTLELVQIQPTETPSAGLRKGWRFWR
jgi:hypothetical protein